MIAPNDIKGIITVKPDKTAPQEQSDLGNALFTVTCLSQILELEQYMCLTVLGIFTHNFTLVAS